MARTIVSWPGFLEHVAARAGLAAALQQVALGVRGEQHDGGAGHAVADAAGGGDAVDVAHAHVHQDDGGAAALGEHDGGFAVTGLAHDADVRLARERHAQTLANDLMVVCDQAGDRLV